MGETRRACVSADDNLTPEEKQAVDQL